MRALLEIGLANAVMALLLAVPAACAHRFSRRPALVHSLWLLVLVKLVTPPLPVGRFAVAVWPAESEFEPVAVTVLVAAPPVPGNSAGRPRSRQLAPPQGMNIEQLADPSLLVRAPTPGPEPGTTGPPEAAEELSEDEPA